MDNDEMIIEQDVYDFQEVKWDEYLLWCRANEAIPHLSDFLVWLDDFDEFI